MKGLVKSILGAVSILAMTTSMASAAIVCNGEGDCWHTRGHDWIRPGWGLTVHPNDWKWRDRDHYRWREHAGRGYWRDGRWEEVR
jgi:hypothetical protein